MKFLVLLASLCVVQMPLLAEEDAAARTNMLYVESQIDLEPKSEVKLTSNKDHYLITILLPEKKVFWGVNETFGKVQGSAIFTVLPTVSLISRIDTDTESRFTITPRNLSRDFDSAKPFAEYAEIPLFDGVKRIGDATIFDKDHRKIVYKLDRKLIPSLGKEILIVGGRHFVALLKSNEAEQAAP